jgi:hypothetical protein
VDSTVISYSVVREEKMKKAYFIAKFVLVMVLAGYISAHAKQEALNVSEFRKLYDSLLSGKTLVSETKQNGAIVKKERHFGNALDVGDGDFEIPVRTVVTTTTDGKLDQKVTIDILDRVNDIGGHAIVYEEIRKTTVEEHGSGPSHTSEPEFAGLFTVSKNEKGGFDVHTFGLIPSVLIEGNSVSLAGSMVTYSCFPEGGKSKCVLTIRDYKLGDYTPLDGYTLVEPIEGDLVEVAEEVTTEK